LAWYHDAIIYQAHIRAFKDSNADGHGDLRGLIGKLDYIKSLGVDCIWLMPMHPSPLVDDGYDVADYRQINHHFGTLADFETLMKEARARDLKVIVDFVVNHTSDQHPWFLAARSSLKSHYRDYYVWSDTGQEYKDVRVIFPDFEHSNWSFDANTGQYFWHRFYERQPDLNYDNPQVQSEMLDVARYWLSLGADGFRVDAVAVLFEREGTSCEHLPETHQFYKRLRRVIDEEFPGRVLICEAGAKLDKLLEYFGDDDEFHLGIHFHFAASLFACLAIRTREPLQEVLRYANQLPDSARWATYIRSHDALALGFLSERYEQRTLNKLAPDHNHRFARNEIRRRLNPLLNNNLEDWILAFSILFSFPGCPIIYYGDEIGLGDNMGLHDRFPCRLPMQWDASHNGGFSEASHTFLPTQAAGEYSFHNINVEKQEKDESSRLNLTRRFTRLYREIAAFRSPKVGELDAANKFVLAYVRRDGDEEVRCLFNLRDNPQAIDAAVVKNTEDLLGLYPFDSESNVIPPKATYWLRVKR